MKDTFKRFAIVCLSLFMVLTLGGNFFSAHAEEEGEQKIIFTWFGTGEEYEIPLAMITEKQKQKIKELKYDPNPFGGKIDSDFIDKRVDEDIAVETISNKIIKNMRDENAINLGNGTSVILLDENIDNIIHEDYEVKKVLYYNSEGILKSYNDVNEKIVISKFDDVDTSKPGFLVVSNKDKDVFISQIVLIRSWELKKVCSKDDKPLEMKNNQYIIKSPGEIKLTINFQDRSFTNIGDLKIEINNKLLEKSKIFEEDLEWEVPERQLNKDLGLGGTEHELSEVPIVENDTKTIAIELDENDFEDKVCNVKLSVLEKSFSSEPMAFQMRRVMMARGEAILMPLKNVATVEYVEENDEKENLIFTPIELQFKLNDSTSDPTPTVEPTHKPDVPSNPTTPITYNLVKFNAEEGVPSLQTQVVPVGGKARQSEVLVPVRNGYEFVGWYYYEKDSYKLGPNGRETMLPFSFDQAIYGDIDLYAKWKKIEEDTGVEEEEKKPVPSTADC